jgi:hypothetical protein
VADSRASDVIYRSSNSAHNVAEAVRRISSFPRTVIMPRVEKGGDKYRPFHLEEILKKSCMDWTSLVQSIALIARLTRLKTRTLGTLLFIREYVCH